MSGESASTVTITPEMAKEWLENHNKKNRNPKPALVSKLAGAMKRGEWRFNGEAIKFSKDGRLLDGQHRLMAVAFSGVPLTTVVINGLEDEAQETMDQGVARSLNDALKMRGEERVTILASAIRIVRAFEVTGIPVGSRSGPMTVQEGIACLKKNPDLRMSAKFTDPFMAIKWIPATVVCGLHYLFATYNHEDAAVFLTRMRVGADLSEDNPIFVVRQRLITARVEQEGLDNYVKTALVIKAWNAFERGETMRAIQFRPGGANAQQFPTIHGVEAPSQTT